MGSRFVRLNPRSNYLRTLFGAITLVVVSLFVNVLNSLDLEDQSFELKYNPLVHLYIFNEIAFGLASSGKTTDIYGTRYPLQEQAKNLFRAFFLDNTFPTKLEKIELDVGFEQWQMIANDRKLATIKGINRNSSWVAAKLNINGVSTKAEVRLKGNAGQHWAFPERWSLRIKLKNGAVFKGMREFSVQRPAARQFPGDFLFQRWHQEIGGLVPRFAFSKFKINGRNWGVMLIEEAVNIHMIELAKRKASPTFKLISDPAEGGYYYSANRHIAGKRLPKTFYDIPSMELIQASKASGDDRIMMLYSYAHASLKKFHTGKLVSADVFDLKSLAGPLSLSMIWGTWHTLGPQNSRYYINPYTLLIEPITSDQNKIHRATKDQMEDAPFPYGEVFRDPSSADLLRSSMPSINKSMHKLSTWHSEVCQNFPLDCPSLDSSILESNFKLWSEVVDTFESKKNTQQQNAVHEENQEQIGQNDQTDDNGVDYPEHIYAEHYDNGELLIYNYLVKNVNVESITLKCSKKAKRAQTIICNQAKIKGYESQIPPSNYKTGLAYIKLQTGIKKLMNGMAIEIITSRNKESKVLTIPFTMRTGVYNPILKRQLNVEKIETISWIKRQGNDFVIKRGKWNVDEPLIFPVGTNLVVELGTTLSFAENAYLLIRGALIADGSKNAPIVFGAKNNFWKGVYVLKSEQKSLVRHVKFTNTRSLEDGALMLTGGVTFYKSDLALDHVTFSGSVAEDALNVVESEFFISNVSFENTRSDAIDSDFSFGTLSDAKFRNIGGDAFDLAGSEAKVNGLLCETVDDKCLSVGEGSTLNAQEITTTQTFISVASKDGSTARISGLLVKNPTGHQAMAYIKKNAYGPAWLSIKNTNLKSAQILCEKGSHIEVNGVILTQTDIDKSEL